MHARIALVTLLSVVLGACQRGEPSVQGAAATAAAAANGGVAQVEGIEWFEGSLDAAFEHAAREGRLVFLYWGAQWCPPCYDLKAHVFPRPDFQQALRQFVAVYLDGDAPGAQLVAERFGVQGYPSAVVLKADRTELARISGGSDLASYADVLALALADAQPVQQLLSGLSADTKLRLDGRDCRRLAWNDWSGWKGAQGDLVAALRLAAARCPDESRVERDRLIVTAADLAAQEQWPAMAHGAAPGAPLLELTDAVAGLLGDPARSLEAGTALLYLGDDFFRVVHHARSTAQAARLQEDYFTFLDALEADARQSDTVRLLSAAKRLQVAKALHGTHQVPATVAARALTTLDAYLDRHYEPNARAGIVNSASWVLYELGDDARLRVLLEEQMQTSRTPYYYMPDMADIEERAGNMDGALAWLERGYRESKGPATRFQWGTQYLHGLLRMSPADESRIRTAVLEVIAELDGANRIHARARTRLERLDEALDQWAQVTGNADTLTAIGQRWRALCERLPAGDPARAACPDLLG
jgi:thiol-disulfide isomerase/thioredoxin